jgi:hypothetical protein
VIVSRGDTSLLSDPWYYGDSFHKGWNLLVEQSKEEVDRILRKITHIWISHEHPDHFSVRFFLDFKEQIISNSIQIIFQNTKDKRVINFLKSQNFNVKEITFNKEFHIAEDFKITCIKDGFYDSALYVKTPDKKILNLNDCEINTEKKAKQIKKICGVCDILLTQFSYAAWKGGKENLSWRINAAEKKIDSIKLQIEIFKPKILIPFASYIFFSNLKNYYLNDRANTPKDIMKKINKNDLSVAIMKPYDEFIDDYKTKKSSEAIEYWEDKYSLVSSKTLHTFDTIEKNELNTSFKKYIDRIFKKNSKFMIFLARYLSPISVFKKIVIFLDDIDETVVVDLLSNELVYKNLEPDLVMSSESFNFILNNSFGFDTLTVNGCFEEKAKEGFLKSTKSLAIENLNNMGIYINIFIFVNFKIISIFFDRIKNVRKNQKN